MATEALIAHLLQRAEESEQDTAVIEDEFGLIDEMLDAPLAGDRGAHPIVVPPVRLNAVETRNRGRTDMRKQARDSPMWQVERLCCAVSRLLFRYSDALTRMTKSDLMTSNERTVIRICRVRWCVPYIQMTRRR